MTDEERAAFDKANQKIHPVETQWHHKYMVKYGFIPKTKEAQGFVRAYTYEHPAGHTITCNTGVNADYWNGAGGGGYWSDLEPHLKKLEVETE